MGDAGLPLPADTNVSFVTESERRGRIAALRTRFGALPGRTTVTAYRVAPLLLVRRTGREHRDPNVDATARHCNPTV